MIVSGITFIRYAQSQKIVITFFDEGYYNLLTLTILDESYPRNNILTLSIPDEGYPRNNILTLSIPDEPSSGMLKVKRL
jgi:hypothetical protein